MMAAAVDMQTSAHPARIAPGTDVDGSLADMLAHVPDPTWRERVLALERLIADMRANGYKVCGLARAIPATNYTYSQWQILIKHAGAQCVLSFPIHETPEVTNETQSHKRASARAHSRHA